VAGGGACDDVESLCGFHIITALEIDDTNDHHRYRDALATLKRSDAMITKIIFSRSGRGPKTVLLCE
jgi:hypothetical protein